MFPIIHSKPQTPPENSDDLSHRTLNSFNGNVSLHFEPPYDKILPRNFTMKSPIYLSIWSVPLEDTEIGVFASANNGTVISR